MKWSLVFVIVSCTVASDVLQAHAMKCNGEITDFSARSLTRILSTVARRRHVILSIGCMALSFFVYLRLLQIAALSFSVPATAITYVGDALFARFLFHEELNWQRWTGIIMIACGVVSMSW